MGQPDRRTYREGSRGGGAVISYEGSAGRFFREGGELTPPLKPAIRQRFRTPVLRMTNRHDTPSDREHGKKKQCPVAHEASLNLGNGLFLDVTLHEG
jgi:hypothetical protein